PRQDRALGAHQQRRLFLEPSCRGEIVVRGLAIATVLALGVRFSTATQAKRVIQPDAAKFSKTLNSRTQVVEYRGRRAVKLVPAPETAGKDEDMLAILDSS